MNQTGSIAKHLTLKRTPWLAKQKSINAPIDLTSCLSSNNTDAGLCTTQSKQSKTTKGEIRYKIIHSSTAACGFACVCACAHACEIWDVVNCGGPTVAVPSEEMAEDKCTMA